jgi:hypothetical protein
MPVWYIASNLTLLLAGVWMALRIRDAVLLRGRGGRPDPLALAGDALSACGAAGAAVMRLLPPVPETADLQRQILVIGLAVVPLGFAVRVYATRHRLRRPAP